AHSFQADPRFVNAAAADYHLLAGSPAIDAATSAAAEWPATDAGGAARVDDPRVADTGEGPVTFGDLGAFEFEDVHRADGRPAVVSPAVVRASRGQRVEFTVTASDPDGDAIQSLRMVPLHMAHGSTAVFAPSA